MVNLFILGPAGSGKTTLSMMLGRYFEEQGFTIRYVNLDAAVEELPYKAFFDIRKYYTVTDIMSKFRIGPNTALIKSVELILEHRKEIEEKVKKLYDSDYVIIDTPGQLELVIFHKCGVEVMKMFRGRSCGIFLIPADLIVSTRDFAFLKLLTLAVKYRLHLPLITVISKSDLIKELPTEFEEYIIREELEVEGIQTDLVIELWKIINKLGKKQRIIKVSSLTGEGITDLHSIIYEIFCTCGDLT